MAGLGRNTLDCCRPEACFCESSTSSLLAPTRELVTSTRPSSPQGDTSFVFLALRQLVLARLRLRPSPNSDGGAQIRVTTATTANLRATAGHHRQITALSAQTTFIEQQRSKPIPMTTSATKRCTSILTTARSRSSLLVRRPMLLLSRKGQLPPVRGFWSLTVYNPEHLFYPNAMNRFSLGTKNKSLKYDPDGSLTIYLGNKSPGEDKETNWLPAPSGNFSIWLRAYWPDQAVLNGTWKPPMITRTEK